MANNVENIFNFRENIGDGQHDSSVALSEIEFPSHISELESFQSEFDNDSLSISTSSHPQQEFQTEQELIEPRQTSAEGSEVRCCMNVCFYLKESAYYLNRLNFVHVTCK